MKNSRTGRAQSVAALLGCSLVLCGCASFPPAQKPAGRAEALALFSQGLLAEAGGRTDEAIRSFEQALALDPEALSVYPYAIAARLKQSDTEGALTLARTYRLKSPTAPAMLMLVQIHELSGRSETAEALLEEAVTLFPDDPRTHLSLARFHIGRSAFDTGIAALEKALRLTPDHPELHRLLGTVCMDIGQRDSEQAGRLFPKGMEHLKWVAEKVPDRPRNWLQFGYAALLCEQSETALSAFERAYELDPENPAAALQLFRLYLAAKDLPGALSLYKDHVLITGNEAPEIFQAVIELAQTREEHEKLVDYLEERLEGNPVIEPFYYAQLSALHIDLEQTGAAEEVLRRGVEHHPGDQRLPTVLGYLCLKNERFEEAFTLLHEIRDRRETPWATDIYFAINYLIAAQKSAHIEEAVEILDAVYAEYPPMLNEYISLTLRNEMSLSPPGGIELLKAFRGRRPDASDALYYLALLQAEEKHYAEALSSAQQFETEALDNTASSNLLDAAFYYQYAALHERTGRLKEAEKLFRKVIAMEPEQAAPAQNYIAYMWAEKGENLDMALSLIEKALETDPSNGAYLDTLGWIYYMQGRYEEALTELTKALAQVEDDPVVWDHLGDTFDQLGQPAEAVNHWRKAARLDAESPAAAKLEALGISPDEPPAQADGREDTQLRP